MLNQKVNIGFVIWGVRNGFEVILASNSSEAKYLESDVISDNMRQVCNTTSESFYSIHRNQKFGVITIYHCDAKDMVGRKAYIAISLYIPVTHRFLGDVYSVLNNLKHYYIKKQGDSLVNMFTVEMFIEQFNSLSCEQHNGLVTPGKNKGYYKYASTNEVNNRFQLLDINGYQAAFFIPSNVVGPEDQLTDYRPISEFKETLNLIVKGYDASKHRIVYKNQPIQASGQSFSFEVKPGDELIISDLINNRKQTFYKYLPDQVIDLKVLFPVIAPEIRDDNPGVYSGGYSGDTAGGGKQKKSSNLRNVLAWGMVFMIVLSLVVIVLDDASIINISTIFKPDEPTDTTPQPTPTNDTTTEKEEGGIDKQFATIKSYRHKVKALYNKQKLTPADTLIIKEKIKSLQGIESVSFTNLLDEVEVSYDPTKAKDPVAALKSIKLSSVQITGNGKAPTKGGGGSGGKANGKGSKEDRNKEKL
jgi:hypothetical protein